MSEQKQNPFYFTVSVTSTCDSPRLPPRRKHLISLTSDSSAVPGTALLRWRKHEEEEGEEGLLNVSIARACRELHAEVQEV